MKIAVLLALLLLVIPSASAEEKTTFDEIVVTATRIEEPLGEISGSVTIVTQEDIQKMNAAFLPDVFRHISGLHVIQYGGAGKTASVLIRGGSSSHTLVLIDGIRMNSTTTGGFDFSGINVDDIERIEIVKGPQSTVYGSDAMAGVISIITKKGEGPGKADASLQAGSYETMKAVGSIAGTYKTAGYRLTATHFRTDGVSAADSGMEGDGYRNSSLSGKLELKPIGAFRIEIAGRYSYDKSELDGFGFGGKAVDDPNFVQRGHHVSLSAKGKLRLSDLWDQTISISLARDALTFRDPDTWFNNAETLTTIRTIEWQHDFFPADCYAVVAGVEYREEKGENQGNFDESLDNYAIYLNNKLKLPGDVLVLTAGIRFDDRDISGKRATYRLGAVYNLPYTGASIRLSYGTGFRAPALNELFFPFYGNPNLKPEETTSWEAGISKDFFEGRLRLSLNYFDQRYENLISTNPETYMAANIADARVKGLETSLSAVLNDHLKLRAGHIYLDSEDRKTGNRLPLRPMDKVTVTTEISIKNLTIAADYIFIGKRFDSSVKRELSSYSTINMNAGYKASKMLTLFVGAENLFNEKYEEAGSYAAPGFSFYGGIRASL